MRNVSAITLTALLVASGSVSLAQWSWQNPSPQANDLEAVTFANEAIGFAVGRCGTILRTTDGGFSWATQGSGTAFDLHSVTSPDPLSAWAAGSKIDYSGNRGQGIVLRTSDGGSTWPEQHTSDRWGFHGACFVDLTRGWVVGGHYDTSVVIRTTDGGSTWTEQLVGVTGPLWDVSFADGNHGIAVGEGGHVVYRTTDSGEHWAPCSTGVGGPIRLNAVHLVDANNGWAVAAGYGRRMTKAGVTQTASEARIIHTTDGGISWTAQLSQQDTLQWDLRGVSFRDEDRGCAVGMGYAGYWAITRGIVFSTTDGGLNWRLSEPGFSTGWPSGYHGVRHYGSGGLVVVGNGGIILTTPDGGAEWQSMLGGTTNTLKGVSFANATEGIAVGDSGTILRTTDSGARWTSQPSGTSLGLTDVTFIDQKHGWIVGTSQTSNSWGPGDSSLILSTTDGGTTWVRQSVFVGTMQLVDLCFVDVNNGWAAGAVYGRNGVILRTTDGGNQWTTSTTGWEPWLGSVHFIDSSTGWACGGGTIVKTTNAGNSWTAQTGIPGTHCKRVYFADDKNGWVAGDRVLRTTDGGASWTVEVDYSSSNNFSSIEFVDANNGWIAGYDYSKGLILTTTDGGAHWITRTVGTHHSIESISFCEDGQVWIVGGGGTILHTTDGGVTFVEGSQGGGVPSSLSLGQNYPNPFNPSTTIRYALPARSPVTLTVYNTLGQQVATLVEGEVEAGHHEVTFDASDLASGVYIYRLSAGDYVQARKLVLVR